MLTLQFQDTMVAIPLMSIYVCVNSVDLLQERVGRLVQRSLVLLKMKWKQRDS